MLNRELSSDSNENRYSFLINNCMVVLGEVNVNGVVTYANPYIYNELGYKPVEIIGKNLFDLAHPDDAKKASEIFKSAIISREQVSMEFKVMHKDKHYIDVSASGRFVNFEGEPKMITVIRDISERKQSEKSLKESTQLLERTFNTLNDAIFILNAENPPLILNCNHAAEEIFGYSKKEMQSHSTTLLHIDKHMLKKFQAELYPSIERDGAFINYEFRMKRKNGMTFPSEHSVIPLHDENKKRIGWVSVIRDIKNRKKAEQKIKESEEKYRNLIETSSMGLMEIDIKKGGVVYINPRLLGLIGYTHEEMIDENIAYNVIYPVKIDDIKKSYKDKDIEFRIITKEGKKVWLSGRTLHHYNAKGELTHLRLWLQDITERKELEEIKSNLLTRISHEFKTPLISIKGFTDLLLTEHRERLDEKTVTFLERVKEGGDRLNLLINQFIESSQLDKFLVKLNLTYENLSNIIRDCIEEMEGLINLRNHTVNLLIHDDIFNYIDKEKIHSVIANLLINSIKYTPKGGIITIQSKIKKQSIIISIKDNGIGLQKEEISQIFQPFGKIEKYGKGWDIISDGIGLGLHLSKEIIDLHGGKIWVESEGKNKGSVFYLLIPVRKNKEV